jgi:hypothetical protein
MDTVWFFYNIKLRIHVFISAASSYKIKPRAWCGLLLDFHKSLEYCYIMFRLLNFSEILGFRTLSIVLVLKNKLRKNMTFRKLDLFPSSGEGEIKPILLGTLERDSLNHCIFTKCCVLPCKEPAAKFLLFIFILTHQLEGLRVERGLNKSM